MNTRELAGLLRKTANELEGQEDKEVCLESLILTKLLGEAFPEPTERGTDLCKLQSEVWKIAEEKGWHEKEVPFGEFISQCHAELSEAFEIYRVKGDTGINYIQPFEGLEHTSHGQVDLKIVATVPKGIPIELADVVMRILDYCETRRISLFQAMQIKMMYNRVRTYRHGGKHI